MTGRLLSTLLDSLIVHSAYSNHPSRLRYTSVRQVRWEEGISRQASIWVVASGWSVAGCKAFWGPSLDCPISYLSQRGYAITHLPQWASFSVGCKLGKSLIREGSSLGKARVRNNPRITRDHDIFTLTMGSLTDCNYPFWTGKSSGETLTVASASIRILNVADTQLLCRLPTLSFPRLLRIRCVKDSPVCSSAPSIARAPSCGASALCCQACKHSPRQLDGGK